MINEIISDIEKNYLTRNERDSKLLGRINKIAYIGTLVTFFVGAMAINIRKDLSKIDEWLVDYRAKQVEISDQVKANSAAISKLESSVSRDVLVPNSSYITRERILSSRVDSLERQVSKINESLETFSDAANRTEPDYTMRRPMYIYIGKKSYAVVAGPEGLSETKH